MAASKKLTFDYRLQGRELQTRECRQGGGSGDECQGDLTQGKGREGLENIVVKPLVMYALDMVAKLEVADLKMLRFSLQ